MDTAYDLLRKKGLAAAAKKSSRHAAEGLVGLAQSSSSSDATCSSSSSAVVEINSETDFVAKTEVFLQLVQDVAKAALTLPQSAAGADCELDLQQVGREEASCCMTHALLCTFIHCSLALLLSTTTKLTSKFHCMP